MSLIYPYSDRYPWKIFKYYFNLRLPMARRVLMAEVSGGRVRGRPRLGWMDGVKVALGNTESWWRLHDNARKTRKRGEPLYICNWMSFMQPSLLGSVFFRTTLPCSGGYHMERGGMPLHDAVGINCEKGATLKIKAQLSSIWAKGCILMIVCVFYLTWHDYPSLV